MEGGEMSQGGGERLGGEGTFFIGHFSLSFFILPAGY